MVRLALLGCCAGLMVMAGGAIGQPSIAQVRSDATAPTNAQKTQSTKAEGDRLLAEGDRLSGQAQYSAALDVYQKALGIYRAIGDRKGEGYSLRGLGNGYLGQKDCEKSIKFQNKALTIAHEIQESDLESRTLNNIGVCYKSLKQTKLSVDIFQKSLRLSRRTNNKKIMMITLGNLGGSYKELKDYDNALNAYKEKYAIAEQFQDSTTIAEVFIELGNIYGYQLMKYASAVDYYHKALSISKIKNNKYLEYRALANLSDTYFILGDYSKCIEYAEVIKVLGKEYNDITIQATAAILLTASHYGAGTDNMDYFITESIDLSQKSKNIFLERLATAYGGWWYADRGDYEKSMTYVQKSLSLLNKSLLDGLEEVASDRTAYYVLARIYQKKDQFREAIIAYQQFSIGGSVNQLRANIGLAQLYRDLNMITTSISYYKAAINTFESIRQNVQSTSSSTQQQFFNAVQGANRQKTTEIYRELADLLISQGRIAEAQEVLELLKIQELNDFTKSVRSPTRLPEVGLTNTEKEVITQHGSLIEFSQNLETCRNQKCSQLEALRQQRDRLNIAFNNRLKTIEETTAKEAQLEIDKKSKDVRDNTAALIRSNPNSLVIYPIASANKVNLIWAGSGGLPYAIPSEQLCPIGETQFFGKIREFHSLIKTQNSDIQKVKAIGKELYDCLVKPLEPEIKKNGIKHLVFVPDRATNYIPMGALFDGEKFLIERFSFSSSLSVETTDTSPSPLKNISASSVLGLGVTQKIEEFPALKNVETELRSIVKLDPNQPIGIFPGVTLFNDQFSRSALEENIRQGYSILHIATHGEFASSKPQDSYLLLGQSATYGDEKIPSYRYPIFKIQQNLTDFKNIHLVVLSACETGLGGKDPNSGIEVMGISSFFLGKEKAKSVIASLWRVDDASTSLQMQRFYQHLAQGKTKAQALQQAQIDLLNIKNHDDKQKAIANLPRFRNIPITSPQPSDSPKSVPAPGYTHPYYWAPFILIGNSL